jgi:hypothetical protein
MKPSWRITPRSSVETIPIDKEKGQIYIGYPPTSGIFAAIFIILVAVVVAPQNYVALATLILEAAAIFSSKILLALLSFLFLGATCHLMIVYSVVAIMNFGGIKLPRSGGPRKAGPSFCRASPFSSSTTS